MIELSRLPKSKTPAKRRLGRGHGSGRGKTAGRGTKGQKARGRIRAGFEGGQLPLTKRLPLYRGKGRNKAIHQKPLVVNLKFLNVIPANSTVDRQTLVKYRILREEDAKNNAIKILGEGTLTHPLTIALPISRSAARKIEKAGGRVEIAPIPVKEQTTKVKSSSQNLKK